jgi:hypothetical protein
VLPTLEASYYDDDFYAVGFGKAFSSGVSIGANLKRVIRRGGLAQVQTSDLLDPTFTENLQSHLMSRLNAYGTGFGCDLGIAYRPDVLLNPTVGLSWQDFGNTSFRSSDSQNPVKNFRDNLIFSATFEQDLPLIGLAGGLEYRHIRNNDEQLGKKLHLGAELRFLFLDLRAGLYQGYPSYGLGLSFWLIQFDLVSYSNEFGVYPGQTPQDRIHLALNMNLSFDPDFKLIRFDGERRSLKRRR